MDNLSIIEQENGISLPLVYKEFFKRCSFSVPDSIIGTDLRNNCSKLNQWALELLQENGVENFIDKKDFVFMMHQGYMFWYFRADGNPNPFVFGFREGNSKPDNFGHLSDFIACM